MSRSRKRPSATTDSAKPAPRLRPRPTPRRSRATGARRRLVGLSVYNDSNESLGSINDLLTDKSGNIKAVVIGVGGFLGVGEHLVAVPFDKVKFVNEPIAYTGARGRRHPAAAAGARTTTTGAANTAPAATPAKPNPWYPDHAVFSATKDQLKAMPEFKYSIE